MKTRCYWMAGILSVLVGTSAMAGWEPVEELGQGGPTSEMLDSQACSFRFHLRDASSQGSNQYKDQYFLVDKIHQTRHDGFDGAAYTQTFRASIDRSSVGALNSSGAMDSNYYSDILALYNSPKNPWALGIEFSRNASLYQLVLRYYYFNESAGATYTRSVLLDKDKFVLEARCSPAQVIQGITASASSSYSGYGPERMVDDNDSSYWIGGQSQSSYTLDFDLGALHKVDDAEIVWYSAYYAGTDFSVLVSTSDSGEDFVPVQDHLNAASSVDMGKVSARRVRIQIDAIGNQYYPVIREVKFAGWSE